MNQYIPHSQSIRQFKIGGLIIAVCPYGIDYYWRIRQGYLFTSAPLYVCNKTWFMHIHHGLQRRGKWVISLPKWWRGLWFRQMMRRVDYGSQRT